MKYPQYSTYNTIKNKENTNFFRQMGKMAQKSAIMLYVVTGKLHYGLLTEFDILDGRNIL
jgi:hypothetical protein